jgi:hypothetical protein
MSEDYGNTVAPPLPYDLQDKRSLYNIVPEWLRGLISMVPTELFYEKEEALRVKASADARLNRIRMAFWQEYDEAQSFMRQIDMLNVSRATGVSLAFIKHTVSDNRKLAFVLCAPIEYDMFLDEACNHGLSRLRQILDAPMYDPDGRPDHKTMELVLKAVAFIDMRKNGGIMQKSMNVHAFANDSQTKRFATQINSGDIDKRLEELERKKSLIAARSTVGEQVMQQIEVGKSDDLIAEFSRVGDRALKVKED